MSPTKTAGLTKAAGLKKGAARPRILGLGWVVSTLGLLTLSACGSGSGSLESQTPPRISLADDEAGVAPPIENVQAPITHLEREEVNRVVDEGLGRFLQNFSTEPSLDEEGAFLGFRITRVQNRDYFEGLGIGPGDVVTGINGHPIERPTQAYEAFVGLKSAPSLDIEYLRGGRTMHLSLPILGSDTRAKSSAQKPGPTPAAASTTAPGSAASPSTPAPASSAPPATAPKSTTPKSSAPKADEPSKASGSKPK